MVYIGSIGLGIPPNNLSQSEVKNLIKDIFRTKKVHRLLPVFDNAYIDQRQFVVDEEWIRQEQSFATANHRYFSNAKALCLNAIDNCLTNNVFLNNPIPYEGVDMVMFVSSTGIVTPSLDAYLLNERPFREDIIRLPIWGLGCAGGAMGMARASEWIRLHPSKTALVICCELCSLTFQKQDSSTSNIVGTALFGDGVGATLLIGQDSEFHSFLPNKKLEIKDTSSFTKKNSTDVMGWNVTSSGLEVIFSKRIPKLVKTVWKEHVKRFLQQTGIKLDEISSFIAHPGGRKVLEEMEQALQIDQKFIQHSYHVLKKHGNMSSATVIYVLNQWLLDAQHKSFSEKLGILSALGPGFSSELILLEWVNK